MRTRGTAAAAILACLLASTAAGPEWGSAPHPDRAGLLEALTATRLTIVLDRVPARTVLERLALLLDVPLVARFADDRTPEGIDPLAPITLEAIDEPVVRVLERALEQCGSSGPCTWQLGRGFVEAGTKERLARTMETRVYHVQDMLAAIPAFDNAPRLDVAAALAQSGPAGRGGSGSGAGGPVFGDPGEPPLRGESAQPAQGLADLITATVEPDVWQARGGGARITPRGGSLVVRAPDFVHRRLGG